MIKCIFDSYFLLPAITLLSSLGNTALCPAAHHYTLITFSLNFPSSCISQGGGRVCTRALDPEREAAIAQCWGEEGSVQWFHLQPLDQASQPKVAGYKDVDSLRPRQIVSYSLSRNSVAFIINSTAA